MSQSELPFDAGSPDDGSGYHLWLEQRKLARRELALRLGLPLGQPVEVWLRDGVRLEGRLELAGDLLLVSEADESRLKFVIERTDFTIAEIESCVRIDQRTARD